MSDSLTDTVLQFYDQLGEETDANVKKLKGPSSPIPRKSSKYLKVDPKSINLSKTLEKITQKEIDKKKSLRKKSKKARLKLINETKDMSSVVKEPQKSKIDVPTDKNESISVSLHKYEDILTDIQEVSGSTSDHEQLYVSCKPQEDGSLLVTLFPNSKLFLIGYYSLHLILGGISVLGYKFKKDEKHVVYSPASHSILSINCHDGFQVKKFDIQQIKDLHIPLEYVQDLNISMDQPVVIVRLNRYCSNVTQILNELQIMEKKKKLNLCLWKETIDVELVEDRENCKDFALLNESEEWTSYIEEIQPSVILSSKNILVITGGKGVGKSTLLKYIINQYLSIFKVSHVACIDLDPGQPEFSLPGCLTLSVCSSPLLGPSFSHHENSLYSYQKQILLGDISMNHLMNEYLSIASHLYRTYKEKFSDMPLVVNTMGFTSVTGYEIMIDILRIFDPTHVINIESTQANKNYPTPLTTKIVSTTNSGILRNNSKNLNYDLAVFKSISKESLKVKNRLSREINIMGYLSLLWKKNESNLTFYTINPPLTINWRRVAIHVHRSFVPPSHSLLAINGSLVALCSMGENFLYKVDHSQPLQIHYNFSSLLSCECIAWGVVRGIDPISREISIFTTINAMELRKVNLVAMPNVQLPVYFRKYFSTTHAPYVKKK